jgi:hypothetical protein
VERFVARHRSLVTCVLSGFDRLVFRGTLIPLVRERGMHTLLNRARVRLLDFGRFVETTSNRVRIAALREAERADRPVRYLTSSQTSKEDLARQILDERPVARGLVCAFTAVEPCMSFEYHRSKDRQERGLKLRLRKCLHVYKYYLHPLFGFINARIQTWFPFNIQICLNGREWLARQLSRRRHSDFARADNCFTHLGDPELAQRLMNEQLETNWAKELTAIARRLNPLHEEIFQPWPQDYYWSTYQSEWATDLLFESPEALASIYPGLVRHATLHFASPDVMRFLCRKKIHGQFEAELTSSFKRRREGVRVKHWVHGNSIKMYDKAGSVLRIETTIAKTTDFKVLRPLQDDPHGKLEWRPLRKGVADLHRRAEVSQQANERYLDALAASSDETPLATILDQVSLHTTYRGRRVRGLRIGDADDIELLSVIARGEFGTAGFRNRDIRALLHPNAGTKSKTEQRRLTARVGRRLRLLRAHGIVQKVQKSHLYKLTDKGRVLTAALFAVRGASIKQLLASAA